MLVVKTDKLMLGLDGEPDPVWFWAPPGSPSCDGRLYSAVRGWYKADEVTICYHSTVGREAAAETCLARLCYTVVKVVITSRRDLSATMSGGARHRLAFIARSGLHYRLQYWLSALPARHCLPAKLPVAALSTPNSFLEFWKHQIHSTVIHTRQFEPL